MRGRVRRIQACLGDFLGVQLPCFIWSYCGASGPDLGQENFPRVRSSVRTRVRQHRTATLYNADNSLRKIPLFIRRAVWAVACMEAYLRSSGCHGTVFWLSSYGKLRMSPSRSNVAASRFVVNRPFGAIQMQIRRSDLPLMVVYLRLKPGVAVAQLAIVDVNDVGMLDCFKLQTAKHFEARIV